MIHYDLIEQAKKQFGNIRDIKENIEENFTRVGKYIYYWFLDDNGSTRTVKKKLMP